MYDPLDPGSLTGNSINGIAQDAAGVIWIATTNGLSRYDAATDRSRHFERARAA